MRKRDYLVRGLVALFVLAGACICLTVNPVESRAQWSESTIAASYPYGTEFSVPSKTLTIHGKTVQASSTIRYPDGTLSQEPKILLSAVGEYFVTYYAESDGIHYSTEDRFTVDHYAYHVSDPKSSLRYGSYTDFGSQSDGLLVRLANGDTLTFGKVIDVTKLTAVETNAIVSGFITPDIKGAADFNKLTFTLTDIVDPSVYLTIDINRSQFSGKGKGISWVMAGGNGQDMVGEEVGKGLHVNDDVGTPIDLTFIAQTDLGGWDVGALDMAPDSKKFALMLDYSTLTVYGQSAKKVSQLNSAQYYETLWNGFPSGKARLRVSASGYSGATANFCITDVFGYDSLADSTFEDTEGPEIYIDTDYETMPNAEAGFDKPYPVPSATAFDTYSGVCDVDTQVFLDYASGTPISVSMTQDGFIPDRIGLYTILYTARDAFGKTSWKELSVKAVREVTPISVTIPADVITKTELGTHVTIKQPIMSGGSGELSYTVSAEKNGEQIIVPSGETFVPKTEGEWTITYTVKDYIGKMETVSYVMNAVRGEKPLLGETPVLPKIYISGSEYALPVLYADDYTGSDYVQRLCDVRVEDASGIKTYKAGDSFTPTVQENGDIVRVTYFCGTAKAPVVEVPAIIGRNGSEVLQENYIFGQGFTLTTNSEETDAQGRPIPYMSGYLLNVSEGHETACNWVFAKPQSKNNVSLGLKTVRGKSDFASMRFSLTDTTAPGRTVTLAVDVYARKLSFRCGDYTAETAISLLNDVEFSFAYTSNKFVFSSGQNTVNVPIHAYDDGTSFDGFSGEEVYVGFGTERNTAETAYLIQTVGGAVLSFRNRDNLAPEISVSGNYGGNMPVGSVYTVCSATASDVFAPRATVTLTVFAPDGNIMSDVNGVKLEDVPCDNSYDIRLTDYGVYTVKYIATEYNWMGNTGELNAPITVMDETPPNITFTSAPPVTAQKGDIIRMPDYTVSDNITPENEILVCKFVITANGRYVELKADSNSIKADYAGEYTFCVMATDEYGNSAVIRYSVTVNG